MQETWVRSLGQEDPLEKEMATRSSILAWRIPWTKEPGGQQSMGSQDLDIAPLGKPRKHTWPIKILTVTKMATMIVFI